MAILIGPTKWWMERDEESRRTYHITYKVKVNPRTEGPAAALQCSGLPQYGDTWNINGDIDVWAWCRYETQVQPDPASKEGEPISIWMLTFRFSTIPDKLFCLEAQQQDPLLIPDRLSGEDVDYTEEAVVDRFGNPIVNSAWEQLRGPQVEFDKNRGRVHIEKNVALLQWELVEQFKNKVNAFPMWNMQPRCVKLSKARWTRQYYGVCYVYYTWIFDFDIRADTFDRYVLDEGTKVLNGHWDAVTGHWILDNINGAAPDPTNPQHFIRYQDRQGNNSRVILNGAGLPAGVVIGTGTAVPSCRACSTAVNNITIGFSGAGFTGDYVVYNTILNTAATMTVSISNPCFWTSAVGTTNVLAQYETDNIANKGSITLSFVDTTGETPTVVYQLTGIPLTNGQFDCSLAQAVTLTFGDREQCPTALTLTPSGPSTGPPISGGFGIRYIQRYDAVDFTLLGVPLILG